MSIFDKEPQQAFTIGIDEIAKGHLLETARWTKFLGLFLCIILIVCSIVFGVAIYLQPATQLMPKQFQLTLFIGYVIIIGGVYIFPIISLIRFGKLAKDALETGNQEVFNLALKYLKNLFKYIGILAIVMVCIYIIVFILVLIVGLFISPVNGLQ